MNYHSPLRLWDRRARRQCRAAAGGGILYVNSPRGDEGRCPLVRASALGIRSELPGARGCRSGTVFPDDTHLIQEGEGEGGNWAVGHSRVQEDAGVVCWGSGRGGKEAEPSASSAETWTAFPLPPPMLSRDTNTVTQSHNTNIYKSKGPFTPRTIFYLKSQPITIKITF